MRVKIEKDKEDKIIKNLLSEAFCPAAEKVIAVKNYLDKNFKKTTVDDIDENGYPKKTKCALMMSDSKQALKTVLPKELLMILDDKFQKIITDNADRKKFLKQIITDWFNGGITNNGILSKNTIK